MSNALHIKGSRTKVLNTFPTNSFGNDGDIVASRIKGRGTFLCIKAGGMWYAANQLQELRNVSKTSLKQLKAKSISISGLSKSNEDTDRFIVSDGGTLKYRTGEEVLSDLDTEALTISYKTAYCSLDQYNNKEDCWANGGTWYYSENDSHDSLNNTAENELLTIGSSIGKLDAESTLTYDGSTLEIKRNIDFDDNWQTSAQDTLLKLSYDSSNYCNVGVSGAGVVNFNSTSGAYNFLDNGSARLSINTSTGLLTLRNPDNILDYFSIDIDDDGVTTLKTFDTTGTAAHMTLDVDGDITMDAAGAIDLKPSTHTYSALPIGFTQDEPTFDATDTIITFSTTGNKAKLTLTDNCADIHFKFPAVSGNFVCVLLQDGTGGRTISNWKTQDSAGNAGAGNSGDVLWAGGTDPTNTETADKADIASFYWDADNEIAYGTYTYNF